MSATITLENYESATTAELAALLRVKRFSNRQTALKRVRAYLESLQEKADGPEGEPEVSEENGTGQLSSLVQALIDGPKEKGEGPVVIEAGATATPEPEKATKERKSASAAIAASWLDPEVRAARATRNGVVCNGVEYRSVRVAFAANGLPDSKHIKFRMELKAAGFASFIHEGREYKFVIID